MTSLVLIDDHPMVRSGLRSTLGAELDWQVIGEAADGVAGLALALRLCPDVLVVDLQMPGLNGLEVLRQVRVGTPTTRVIIFSMHAEDTYVHEALEAGASGYVLKDADAVDLVHAIRMALRGGRYLSPARTWNPGLNRLGHLWAAPKASAAWVAWAVVAEPPQR